MKEKYAKRIHIFLIAILILSACEANGEELDLGNFDDTLVAEQFVIWWPFEAGVPYQSFAAETLNKRFPNTQFQFIHFNTPPHQGFFSGGNTSSGLIEMMRSQPSPDVIVFDTRFLSLMIETEYLEPIPDAYGVEMDYDIITEHRTLAPDLSLYALPFGRIAEGLFYNKKFFDEMKVPYPKDGITWDGVIELGGVFKKGRWSPIGVTAFDSMASQLSLRLYDAETEWFDFESDEWKELTRTLVDMNDLEDFRAHLDGGRTTHSHSLSFSKGEIAMLVSPLFGHKGSGKTGMLHYESNLSFYEVDWDIASFPDFDDGNRLQPASQMLGIGIPKRSANKEDALKVISHLLSREVQLDNSQKGLISSRADAASFGDEFGRYSILAGKSVAALLSDGPRGVRDPIFEFVKHMNGSLESMVYGDDIWRDIIVERIQKLIRERTANMIHDRQKFIEEMRRKF